MTRRLRPLLIGAALALAAPVALTADWFVDEPAQADAALAVAYTLDELVEVTPRVAVMKAKERKSVWEKIGDSKRIVTYTKLERVESVYGGAPETVWVRTLGGVVGKIGQHVAGEARFRIGNDSLVFLTQTPNGTYVVNGAAQGHYPVVKATEDKKTVRKLSLSPNRGKVVKRKKTKETIQQALNGVRVTRGVTKVKEAKARVDAKKKK